MVVVKIDNGENEEYMKEEIDYNWDNETSNFVHILECLGLNMDNNYYK